LTRPEQRIFRWSWRGVHVFMAIAMALFVYWGWRECTLRWYLDGFSDAIVPSILPAEPKVEAILSWMRIEPSRAVATDPGALAQRDPYMTLNYKQLLNVCGTATNAFLNLAREDSLQVRRLLLLSPEGNTKHVVAEVLIDGRWIVVDPTYRVIMRDTSGKMLTRTDLQRPQLLAEAVSKIPDYSKSYTYERVAHVRMARLRPGGLSLGRFLEAIYPNWDEAVDWSLLLERESFFYLVASGAATLFFLLLRTMLAWYADRRLKIPRFHLRAKAVRAGTAFFSTPEIKE
jgi:hypothetical protein